MSTADVSDNSIEVEAVPSIEEIQDELEETVEISFATDQRGYILFMCALEGGVVLKPWTQGEVFEIRDQIEDENADLHEFAMAQDEIPEEGGEEVEVSFEITKYGFMSMMASIQRGYVILGPEADEALEIFNRLDKEHSDVYERLVYLLEVLETNYDPESDAFDQPPVVPA